MSAHQLDIISKAQQGNPKALAELLNRALTTKHITTKAQVVQNRLTIFAEGKEVPNQQSLVNVIKRGVKDLEVDTLVSIKIYGRKFNSPSEGWIDEIFLKENIEEYGQKISTSKSKSSSFSWNTLRQKLSQTIQQVLTFGRKLVTNKRFVIGAISFILLVSLTTGGIVGFNTVQTRISQQKAIEEAQLLITEAKFSEGSSIQQLTDSADKLTEARDILRGIEKSRGSLYATAQEELAQVRDELDEIDNLINAEESAISTWTAANDKAKQAIQSVNTPPYPVEEWQKAKNDLSNAISLLSSISKNSSYSEQISKALAEYQKKLDWINQGMTNEQKAVQVLQTADELAKQAYVYTSNKSRFQAAELNQAKGLWQKAINHTKTVPPTSDAYRKVSERTNLYTENINEIEDGIREMNDCWTKSYASQSFCNSIYLSLKNPDIYLD